MSEQDQQPPMPPLGEQPRERVQDRPSGRPSQPFNPPSHTPFGPPPHQSMPPAGLPFEPYMPPPRRKSKFAAALLALCIPGTGHFYLGQMQRGIMVMLAIILDIFAIVQLSVSVNASIPLITLFSLLLPVIYFYNIFDALQLTDRINHRYDPMFGDPNELYGGSGDPLGSGLQTITRGNRAGWLLIGVGALFFFLSHKPDWLTGVVDTIGSYAGAVVLIVIGGYLFLRKNNNS